MSQDRCTGHCCRAFVLPVSPDERWRDLWAWLQRGEDGDGGQWFDDEGERHLPHGEIAQIASMVVPLGRFPYPPGVAHNQRPDGDEPVWWYTCSNLRPDGNCGIYATRPDMCRDYPYGRVCQYTDCAWSAAKVAQSDETVTLPKQMDAEALP